MSSLDIANQFENINVLSKTSHNNTTIIDNESDKDKYRDLEPSNHNNLLSIESVELGDESVNVNINPTTEAHINYIYEYPYRFTKAMWEKIKVIKKYNPEVMLDDEQNLIKFQVLGRFKETIDQTTIEIIKMKRKQARMQNAMKHPRIKCTYSYPLGHKNYGKPCRFYIQKRTVSDNSIVENNNNFCAFHNKEIVNGNVEKIIN